MRILIAIQALLTGVFIGALWLHVILRGAYGGIPRPAEPGFLQWWYDLPGHFEFNFILLQLAYPLFWWFTRKKPWPMVWRVVRMVHLIAALAVVAIVAFFFLFMWLMEREGGWRS